VQGLKKTKTIREQLAQNVLSLNTVIHDGKTCTKNRNGATNSRRSNSSKSLNKNCITLIKCNYSHYLEAQQQRSLYKHFVFTNAAVQQSAAPTFCIGWILAALGYLSLVPLVSSGNGSMLRQAERVYWNEWRLRNGTHAHTYTQQCVNMKM
jgi:hypothetical protein